MKKSNRYVYIDILNIVACFFVIILHSTGIYFRPDFSKRWYFAVVLQSVCICAVPLFVMITGATLMDYRKRYTTKEFYKKRISRVVLPFLIWSVIYAVWNGSQGGTSITSIQELITKFLNNEILTIFWFFYAIIGIYIALPVLSIFLENASKQMAWLYVGICFFSVGVIPLFSRITGYSLSKFTIPIAGSLIIYVLLGGILKHERYSNKKKRLVYLAGLAASVCMFFGTTYYSKEIGELDTTFITSSSLFSIVLSTAVFLLVKSISWEDILAPKAVKMIHLIASTSFGVYLIQMIVIFYIKKLPFVDSGSPFYSTFGALAIYILCVMIVLLLKKIPVLNKIVP